MATSIIVADDLTSYLLPIVADPAVVESKVTLANGLVGDVIGDLATVPFRVMLITLEVAARPIRAMEYTSVTITSQGTSKTSRRDNIAPSDPGVYLTAAETAELIAIATDSPALGGIYTMDLGTPQ